MSDNVFIKKLNGYSGCELDLLKINEQLVIRKLSKESTYNKRLKRQCIKQLKFIASDILTPKIFNYSYRNGLFYFDMEFVQGKTLADYSSTISINEIKDFIRLLFKNLHKDNFKYDSSANIIFNKKIEELESKFLINQSINQSIITS